MKKKIFWAVVGSLIAALTVLLLEAIYIRLVLR